MNTPPPSPTGGDPTQTPATTNGPADLEVPVAEHLARARQRREDHEHEPDIYPTDDPAA